MFCSGGINLKDPDNPRDNSENAMMVFFRDSVAWCVNQWPFKVIFLFTSCVYGYIYRLVFHVDFLNLYYHKTNHIWCHWLIYSSIWMTKSLLELASEINLQLFYFLFVYLRTDVKKPQFMTITAQRSCVLHVYTFSITLIQFTYT